MNVKEVTEHGALSVWAGALISLGRRSPFFFPDDGKKLIGRPQRSATFVRNYTITLRRWQSESTLWHRSHVFTGADDREIGKLLPRMGESYVRSLIEPL